MAICHMEEHHAIVMCAIKPETTVTDMLIYAHHYTGLHGRVGELTQNLYF